MSLRVFLFLALLTPTALFAEPLRVQLPEHRTLASSETESFEPALIQRLAEALGRSALVVALEQQVDMRLVEGAHTGTAVYYRARPAALGATEGTLADWSDLQGQPVCVSAHTPYASLLREDFAAKPQEYPSAAHALIGLKLGECLAVIDDDVLLSEIAGLPEWRRYGRLLRAPFDTERQLSLAADDSGLQLKISAMLAQWSADGQLAELTQQWVDEVAFQAYVLADTLDCH